MPIRDDRDLAEQLRRRGYWVQIIKRRVYDAQTDVWLGDSYELLELALWPGEAAKLKQTDGRDEGYGEFEIWTLDPVVQQEVA